MGAGPLSVLASIVGSEHVLVDTDLTAGHRVDWTGRYGGPAIAVVRPGSVDEVAAVLRCCGGEGLAVVPQGGNTGLVGGGVPRADGPPAIVLSMRRLRDLEPVDAAARQVTAGAGATLAEWRDHARGAGLDIPVDFAARAVATIGGAIATNAGGARVLRFGTMRRQVVGIEAVLADGAVVGSLAGLPKETAGLHWPSLLAGSEGTLAVVTRARLRLVPLYHQTATAMVSTASIDDAVELLGRLRAGVPSLDAVEVVLPAAIDLVAQHIGSASPIPAAGCVVLIDCAADHDPTGELAAALQGSPGVVDSAVTTEPGRRQHLLQFRDRITESIAAAGSLLSAGAPATGVDSSGAAGSGASAAAPPYKLDVAVPVRCLGRLLATAEEAAADAGATLIAFGHLAEGNLHLNFLGASEPRRIADEVLPAVAAMGGTISAEHGIGVAKLDWLGLIRTPAELAAQRAIKTALDPRHTLNPGVLDPPGAGAAIAGAGQVP